jgi:hypothetical protein
MYLAIKTVKPLADYKLLITFSNGEVKLLDMTPYLNKGIYAELKDIDKFNDVRISFDTIEWPNEIDLDPEFVYDESTPYTVKNTG